MPALDSMGRTDLQKLAVNARKRLRNAEMDKARMGQRALAVGIGSGAAGLMGYVMGGLNAQAEKDNTVDTDEDPTKLMGIDLDLVVGLVTTIAGVAMSGKSSQRKTGEFVQAAGTGVLAGYFYTYGHSMGKEAEEEAA